jgi:hypothetical protein
MTKRTHDKNDPECRLCVEPYLSDGERICKEYKGEAPEAWVLKLTRADETVAWAHRDFVGSKVIWVDNMLEATSFGSHKDVRAVAVAALTPVELGEKLEILPLSADLLKVAEAMVNKQAVDKIEFPFPGASAIELDLDKPDMAVQGLLGLLGGVFGKLEAPAAPSEFSLNPTWEEIEASSDPRLKMIVGVLPPEGREKVKARFNMRRSVIERMLNMLDEVDTLGVMATVAASKRHQMALVSIRRIICMTLSGKDWIDPRVDCAAIEKALSDPMDEGGNWPEAPEPEKVPVSNDLREWVVEFDRGSVHHNYGIRRAKHPETAIEMVIDEILPYKPTTAGAMDENTKIAVDRARIRRELKATPHKS